MKKTIKNKKSNKGKVILIIVLVLLCLVAGAFLCAYRYYLNNISAPNENGQQVAFTVEEGASMNDIIANLYDQDIIRNDLVAKIYVRLNHINEYYAGNYILDTSMSLKELFAYLGNPNSAITEQAIVTIAPGFWAKDAAEAIAAQTNLTAEEILEKWNDIEYIYELIDKYDVLTEEIFNSQRCYLEGYIYPETYYFYASTTVEQVTDKILSQTQAIYDKYASDIKNSSYSTHDIFTLASVILFEANNEEDMQLVSSVFYNRFAKGMYMQSSVTVCYALYNYSSWVDCERNVYIDSDYNTYQNPGLPVGPVCNPTETAIKAALYPASSDYYYFIANIETGRCIFAKTYDEHLRNINKYLN